MRHGFEKYHRDPYFRRDDSCIMKQTIQQFIKYAIIGASGVLLDLGTLTFFAEVLLFVPWGAVACNQLLVIGYNFSLNKYWTFRNREMVHTQLVRYISLAGVNYVIGIALMYWFNEVFGIHYVLVRIGTIGLMILWNFLLYKLWVFKEKHYES